MSLISLISLSVLGFVSLQLVSLGTLGFAQLAKSYLSILGWVRPKFNLVRFFSFLKFMECLRTIKTHSTL